MNWDIAMSLCYASTEWFVLAAVLLDALVLIRKKSDYVLCMNIRGEQREDGNCRFGADTRNTCEHLEAIKLIFFCKAEKVKSIFSYIKMGE